MVSFSWSKLFLKLAILKQLFKWVRHFKELWPSFPTDYQLLEEVPCFVIHTEVRSNPIFIFSFLRLIASLFARCAWLCNAQSHTLAVVIIKNFFFKVTSLISLFRCRLLHCGRHSPNPVSNQIKPMCQQHGFTAARVARDRNIS